MKRSETHAICGLAALCLVAACDASKLNTVSGDYCNKDQTICFVDVSSYLDLPNLAGERTPYGGQTYAISWGDANGNLWPDLYLNHHTFQSTKGRFPQSHLIYDLGLEPNTWEYIELPGKDQHSAVFVDLDGDRKVEIFELTGGQRGTAHLDDRGTANNVFTAAGNQFDAVEGAFKLGLGLPGARGRSALPINQRGVLKLFLLNAPRPDGLRKSTLMRQLDSGGFGIDEAIVEASCDRGECRDVAAEIGECREALQGHLDRDDFIDIICLRSGDLKELEVFLGSSDGLHFVAGDRVTPFGHFHDGSVLDIDNDGQFELLAIANRRLQLTTFKQTMPNVIDFQQKHGILKFGRPIALVAGDWDNDTDIDFLTYLHSKVESFRFVIWQNDGLGNFKPFRFEDKTNPGHARNVAVADFDLDGALDIIFSDGKAPLEQSLTGGYVLLRGVAQNNWLEIDLRDNAGLRGLGARVTVVTENTSMVRGQYSGVHAEVQDFDRLHFGLGGSDTVRVVVKWADGSESTLTNVTANQILTISQN